MNIVSKVFCRKSFVKKKKLKKESEKGGCLKIRNKKKEKRWRVSKNGVEKVRKRWRVSKNQS